jgi:hypothetical protein
MNPQELLQTYSENAQAFITAARSFPEAKVNLSPAEGEWSAAYVIHHMADYELQFGVRYANALAEENPAIVVFDGAKFPTALHYEKRSVGNSIAAFEAVHNLNYEILKNASPEDWNRTSVHPEKGRVYLTSSVKLCGGHIGAHIEQLKIAEAVGG